MNWLIIILGVLVVVCAFGGFNDKRNALSVIEGAFAHTIEPDSSAFYREVSATYDAPPTGHALKYSTSVRNAVSRSEDTYGGRLQSRPIVRTNGGVKRAYISPYTKKLIASRQKWRCAVCNKLLDASYEIDHIIPLHRGSSSDSSLQSFDNLQALCRSPCHIEKTARENSARSRLH